MSLSDISVPVMGTAPRGTQHHQALRHAVPFLDSAYNVTDMETIGLATAGMQYLTFVCDDVSGSVRVFNTITGELQRTIGTDLGKAYGLALLQSPVPLLFVSSFGQHKILAYNAISGVLVKTIGTLRRPWGVCVRPRRANQVALLYVSDFGDNKVQVFDTESGSSVMTIGTGLAGAGDNQFDSPQGIAIFQGNETAKDPAVFVTDYGNHRIQLFHASTGAFIKSIGAGQLRGPAGVAVFAVDYSNDPLLIVSEYGNNRIQLFNVVTGVSVMCVGSRGSILGQFHKPHGLRAFVVSNNEIVVYVADNSNQRIQKIDILLQ